MRRVIPDWLTSTEVRRPTGTATAELLELELAEPTLPASSPNADATAGAVRSGSGGGFDISAGDCPTRPTMRAVDPRPSAMDGTSAGEHPADPFATTGGEPGLPGSSGEHLLQRAYDTEKRARRFYDDQVLDHLNPRMKEFISGTDLAFIATADGHGECDSSLRAGAPGFIEVLGDRHLAYPEYRGNGVMASLGNISENPHVGMLLVDFVTELIGLHVNGKARILEDADLRAIHPQLPSEFERGRKPERWVVVQVEEAYIHCRKHIPRMEPVARNRSWGTDDVKRKGGDYFAAKGTPRPWHDPQPQHG
ncbi:pyridoxamine 5'-phosphate oxidase family protein [Actinopolyspora halophila]|uniref:pyridoxamine 5'-phosphate oxidase family protein n=1 Tax=Actinopolyspora halophila TaxID=1850 RepID=UPI0003788A5A|nr:pyridoxamine 5'-phosphate oxidase family protein [Actinopolyspora halophila]